MCVGVWVCGWVDGWVWVCGWEGAPCRTAPAHGANAGLPRPTALPPCTVSFSSQVATLSRTYAQAVAGVTKSMSFNTDSKLFTLVYTANISIALPTEIYLNEVGGVSSWTVHAQRTPCWLTVGGCLCIMGVSRRCTTSAASRAP